MTAEERAEDARRVMTSLGLYSLDEERAEAARRLLAVLRLLNLDDQYAAVLDDLQGLAVRLTQGGSATPPSPT